MSGMFQNSKNYEETTKVFPIRLFNVCINCHATQNFDMIYSTQRCTMMSYNRFNAKFLWNNTYLNITTYLVYISALWETSTKVKNDCLCRNRPGWWWYFAYVVCTYTNHSYELTFVAMMKLRQLCHLIDVFQPGALIDKWLGTCDNMT